MIHLRLKTIVDEDFVNYCKPAMFIGTISCGGKCCTEGDFPLSVCQNDEWRACPILSVPDETIYDRYRVNPITRAILFGGLEPFEQFEEIFNFISLIRTLHFCSDDVVIYTGYYPEEISKEIEALKIFQNIIVKFGRFIPNRPHKFEPILGVELASNNQFAMRIS